MTVDLAVVALELSIMLTLSWFTCGFTLPCFRVPDRLPQRIVVRGCAVVLLVLAETAPNMILANCGLAQNFTLHTTGRKLLGLSGQVMFGLFPLWAGQG